MTDTFKKRLLIVLALSLVNMAALIYVMRFLPEQVPIHMGFMGTIDRWGPRWLTVLLGPLAALICLGGLLYVRLTADNPRYNANRRVEALVLPLLPLFFVAVSWLPMAIAWQFREPAGAALPFGQIVCVLLGLLMVVMGNYMGVIRQNRRFGIRLPWTLANEEVWRRTHHVGGYIMVGVGFFWILFGLLALGIQTPWLAMAAILAGLVALIGGTGVYSYRLYRRVTQKRGD